MAKCRELLARARVQPASVSFDDVCALAECFGFVLARQRGSHRLYKRSGLRVMMNFQPDHGGMAKTYQVRQLLTAVEQLEGGGGR
ncbi:MAG: type II toxin-antitoxin system HicA family toxin [Gemmatimonadales bacterium]|nr:type II toxin-antitoxin system HicA family toxin [Gemmatimonadales bacterium]